MTLPTEVFSSESMQALDLWRFLTNLPAKVHLVNGSKQHFLRPMQDTFTIWVKNFIHKLYNNNYNGINMVPPGWVTKLYSKSFKLNVTKSCDWLNVSFTPFFYFPYSKHINVGDIWHNWLQICRSILECKFKADRLTWNIVHKLNGVWNSELHLCFMGNKARKYFLGWM